MSAAPMRKGEVINEDSACLEDADPDEEELRAISSCSLRCFSLLQPGEKILQGPGAGPGPRRYLGVVKPMMLFAWCQKWSVERCLPIPSLCTFMRVLRECSGWLRFRKAAGQHPVCDACWLLGHVHFELFFSSWQVVVN